ncbi:hypothetical protein [Massilia sp. H6]|uniref:hypothetical protein n=1 Tax=Massilia sp. H6 TaxID=2970464 RepID=UPI002168E16A|nr:hypothetical protein [Massilia sp. H6]UVW27701.1 hypothetical protein NRS07_14260 [Massilia sp. H6]
MDANERSEMNNQTDNGANEKWTPGAKGTTTSGPPDHTYPLGDTGPQQGINDSHQRQMALHSDAWGRLEQPVGRRDPHSGTDLLAPSAQQHDNSQVADRMNPQNPAHPQLQGGSLGRHHDMAAGTYQAPGVAEQSFYSNQQSATNGGEGTGMATAHPQDNQEHGRQQDGQASDSAQQGTEHGDVRDEGSLHVHKSNYSAGGLPRSPGNTGPGNDEPAWHPAQGRDAEKNPVHQSNDLAGGLPKSPAGANQLAGDRKMDDDTGFSRSY